MGAAIVNDPGKYVTSNSMKTAAAALMFLGLLGFIVAMNRYADRAWMAYLIGLFYFTSLGLGGLFFASIQHVTKAGWSVNVRRFAEAFTAFLPIAAVLAAVYLIGAPKLYIWLDEAKVAANHHLAHKAPYLNGTFFVIRLVVFFALWLIFKKLIVGRSLKQDESGDVNLTHSLVGVGIGFILVFAITYSLFSVDLLMSLSPLWFSTIFGVYCFAGLFHTTIAFIILCAVYMRKKGLLTGFVTDDHMHDLGKFLFAFTVFWAYIAFSQYMLIWYANLPEETGFIISRTEGSWLPVTMVLLLGKFIVPFLALLPRSSKRNPNFLAAAAVWILVMHFVDIYWLVYPAIFPDAPRFSIWEAMIVLGFLGMFLFAVTRFLSRHNIVPLKDPRIGESLHHHVVY